MDLMNQLEIPNEYYKFNEEESGYKVVKNLSKVNIFIGANNNGKSRFLRDLFSNELNFKPENEDIEKINNKLNYIRENWPNDEVFQQIVGYNFDDYFNDINFLRTNAYLDIKEAIEKLKSESKLYPPDSNDPNDL